MDAKIHDQIFEIREKIKNVYKNIFWFSPGLSHPKPRQTKEAIAQDLGEISVACNKLRVKILEDENILGRGDHERK